MPQSLCAIYVHGIFSTNGRMPFLADVNLLRNVHAYMTEISNRLDCPALEVGGVADHAHILVRLGRTIAIADWMKEVKRVSSAFVKETIPDFSWQAGYGAFSVDELRLEQVRGYIRNQPRHHENLGFQDEFREFLREHRLEWDERYVWQ